MYSVVKLLLKQGHVFHSRRVRPLSTLNSNACFFAAKKLLASQTISNLNEFASITRDSQSEATEFLFKLKVMKKDESEFQTWLNFPKTSNIK